MYIYIYIYIYWFIVQTGSIGASHERGFGYITVIGVPMSLHPNLINVYVLVVPFFLQSVVCFFLLYVIMFEHIQPTNTFIKSYIHGVPMNLYPNYINDLLFRVLFFLILLFMISNWVLFL